MWWRRSERSAGSSRFSSRLIRLCSSESVVSDVYRLSAADALRPRASCRCAVARVSRRGHGHRFEACCAHLSSLDIGSASLLFRWMAARYWPCSRAARSNRASLMRTPRRRVGEPRPPSSSSSDSDSSCGVLSCCCCRPRCCSICSRRYCCSRRCHVSGYSARSVASTPASRAAPPAGTGLRQTGQGTVAEARLLSSTRSKQAWQNWWPHGVTTTCQGSSRQSGQTG